MRTTPAQRQPAAVPPRRPTSELDIVGALRAVARGDFRIRLSADAGPDGELADAFNAVVELNELTARELRRIGRIVGRRGLIAERATLAGAQGEWARNVESVNNLIDLLTEPAVEVSRVLGAVADGDLSEHMPLERRGRQLYGEFRRWAVTVNTMVDQLNAFASEVTRVAREVGTEGKLGGQADVRGVGGTWKDLTDSVNLLAANLTTQVRAIGDVATAVTRGDLGRTVEVDARGEVKVLKDDVNEMIRRLRNTTRENAEQVWLKANLARFSGTLQGERDLDKVARMVLSDLAPLVGALTAAFYIRSTEGDSPYLRLLGQYATATPGPPQRIEFGEGLLGQSAAERRRIVVQDVPANYAVVSSALGRTAPGMIVVVPVLFEGEPLAVIELAALDRFTDVQLDFLDQLSETIGIVLNTIAANQHVAALAREQAARAGAEAGLARLRQVVDVMPEGILLADGSGTIYLHNAAASDIMGAVPESITSSTGPVVRNLDGSVSPPDEQPLARAVQHREVVRGKQLIVTNAATGREVPILVNSAPLSDPLQGAAGGVAVFQDISPLHELEQQRDQFLAAVSHDLRTPVAVIKGRANLLERAVTDAEKPDFEQLASGLRAIDESTASLVRLIDELLDLMQLRMGHSVELDLAPTDLVEITRRVAGEYEGLRPEQPINLVSEREHIVGTWDAARLERVVANLLSNAVKYSDPVGTINVRTSTEDQGGRAWAVLAVQNRGIGIPAADLDRVFDPYRRGSNVSGSISGTGVGLAGVRHIVEQHRGRVEVTSVEGGSTTFTVRLPLETEAADR